MSTDTTKTSQLDEIREHLLAGKWITPDMALRLYGSARLGARIWDLRREGLRIRKTMVQVRTRRGTARVARYELATAE